MLTVQFIHPQCACTYNPGGPQIYPNNVFIDPNICVTSFLKLYLTPFAFLCLFIHVCTNSFIQKLFSETYHLPDKVTAATVSCEQKEWTNHLSVESAKDEAKMGSRMWRAWMGRRLSVEGSVARVSLEQRSKGSEAFSHVAILENSRRRDSMYKTVLYNIFLG